MDVVTIMLVQTSITSKCQQSDAGNQIGGDEQYMTLGTEKTETIDAPERSGPPSTGQRVLGELGRLAKEAIERAEGGLVLEALSSLVALGQVNRVAIEGLQNELTKADEVDVDTDDDFRSGVYL